MLGQFKSNDPELGTLLESKDILKLRSLIMKRLPLIIALFHLLIIISNSPLRSMERHKEKYTEQMELNALEADPMNPELQKKIEERVRPNLKCIFYCNNLYFLDPIEKHSRKYDSSVGKLTGIIRFYFFQSN